VAVAFKCDDCGELKEGWSPFVVIYRGLAVGGDVECELCAACSSKNHDGLLQKVAADQSLTLPPREDDDGQND